jgi:multidrug efflux system membrane fusion protein
MLTQKVCFSTKVGGRAFRAACVVASTVALAACNGSQNAYAPPPPPKVAVAQPLQKPVTLYLNLTGNTSPFNSVDLVARVQGFLTDIDYTDGAAVKAGDKLFGIERDQYQAQLDQANATLASNQATLAYNQAEYGRQAQLGKQDFASQATVQEWKSKADEAAAQVLNAKAAIETAQINLNYTTVNAPFDGVVTRHLVDKGALVGVGSPTKLAAIIQLDPLYVYFTISEPQILRIKVNNAKAGIEFRTTDLSKIPVEIGLQGEDGFPHLGHMDYAAPQVDASTGTGCCLVCSSASGRRSRSWTRRSLCPMWRSGRARRAAICWWSGRTMSSSAKSSRRVTGRAPTASSSPGSIPATGS